MLGSSPSVVFHIEESLDGEHWGEFDGTDGFDPGGDDPVTLEFCVRLPWFRMRVTTGGDTQVTVWAEAKLG